MPPFAQALKSKALNYKERVFPAPSSFSDNDVIGKPYEVIHITGGGKLLK